MSGQPQRVITPTPRATAAAKKRAEAKAARESLPAKQASPRKRKSSKLSSDGASPSKAMTNMALDASSDEEPMDVASDQDPISDPNFFDDTAAEEGAQYDSEEHYWGQVDDVRESDTAFINDEPESVDGGQDDT
ncbi:hypothetical protein HWV62_11938 [Athelia sp. TMB]|nr:hypothetical protein HWV62_11938 [Athelia sp. TMB]